MLNFVPEKITLFDKIKFDVPSFDIPKFSLFLNQEENKETVQAQGEPKPPKCTSLNVFTTGGHDVTSAGGDILGKFDKDDENLHISVTSDDGNGGDAASGQTTSVSVTANVSTDYDYGDYVENKTFTIDEIPVYDASDTLNAGKPGASRTKETQLNVAEVRDYWANGINSEGNPYLRDAIDKLTITVQTTGVFAGANDTDMGPGCEVTVNVARYPACSFLAKAGAAIVSRDGITGYSAEDASSIPFHRHISSDSGKGYNDRGTDFVLGFAVSNNPDLDDIDEDDREIFFEIKDDNGRDRFAPSIRTQFDETTEVEVGELTDGDRKFIPPSIVNPDDKETPGVNWIATRNPDFTNITTYLTSGWLNEDKQINETTENVYTGANPITYDSERYFTLWQVAFIAEDFILEGGNDNDEFTINVGFSAFPDETCSATFYIETEYAGCSQASWVDANDPNVQPESRILIDGFEADSIDGSQTQKPYLIHMDINNPHITPEQVISELSGEQKLVFLMANAAANAGAFVRQVDIGASSLRAVDVDVDGVNETLQITVTSDLLDEIQISDVNDGTLSIAGLNNKERLNDTGFSDLFDKEITNDLSAYTTFLDSYPDCKLDFEYPSITTPSETGTGMCTNNSSVFNMSLKIDGLDDNLENNEAAFLMISKDYYDELDSNIRGKIVDDTFRADDMYDMRAFGFSIRDGTSDLFGRINRAVVTENDFWITSGEKIYMHSTGGIYSNPPQFDSAGETHFIIEDIRDESTPFSDINFSLEIPYVPSPENPYHTEYYDVDVPFYLFVNLEGGNNGETNTDGWVQLKDPFNINFLDCLELNMNTNYGNYRDEAVSERTPIFIPRSQVLSSGFIGGGSDVAYNTDASDFTMERSNSLFGASIQSDPNFQFKFSLPSGRTTLNNLHSNNLETLRQFIQTSRDGIVNDKYFFHTIHLSNNQATGITVDREKATECISVVNIHERVSGTSPHRRKIIELDMENILKDHGNCDGIKDEYIHVFRFTGSGTETNNYLESYRIRVQESIDAPKDFIVYTNVAYESYVSDNPSLGATTRIPNKTNLTLEVVQYESKPIPDSNNATRIYFSDNKKLNEDSPTPENNIVLQLDGNAVTPSLESVNWESTFRGMFISPNSRLITPNSSKGTTIRGGVMTYLGIYARDVHFQTPAYPASDGSVTSLHFKDFGNDFLTINFDARMLLMFSNMFSSSSNDIGDASGASKTFIGM